MGKIWTLCFTLSGIVVCLSMQVVQWKETYDKSVAPLGAPAPYLFMRVFSDRYTP